MYVIVLSTPPLAELGVPLDAGDAELWREFSLIYNCVCLPSETLTIAEPRLRLRRRGGEAELCHEPRCAAIRA